MPATTWRPVLAGGAGTFAIAYALLAASGPSIVLLAVAFVIGGVGIACAETAEHAAVAALAPEHVRGSAFGLLATLRSVGNLAASAVAGALWTLVSPEAAFSCAAGWMLLAVASSAVPYAGRPTACRSRPQGDASSSSMPS